MTTPTITTLTSLSRTVSFIAAMLPAALAGIMGKGKKDEPLPTSLFIIGAAMLAFWVSFMCCSDSCCGSEEEDHRRFKAERRRRRRREGVPVATRVGGRRGGGGGGGVPMARPVG